MWFAECRIGNVAHSSVAVVCTINVLVSALEPPYHLEIVRRIGVFRASKTHTDLFRVMAFTRLQAKLAREGKTPTVCHSSVIAVILR